MIAEIVALNLKVSRSFVAFHTSLDANGKNIGFDATKYEQKAVKIAHKFWEFAVTGLSGATRFPD